MSDPVAGCWHRTRQLFLLILLVALALPVAAQTGLGVVHGTVTDPSHALVADAKVTLTNSATGVARTVQTSAAGVFYFSAANPGPYSVVVEVPHFKKWSGTFRLETGQNVVVDPVLEVGAVQATVEVTGAAPVIETEKGSLSDVKDALRIHELPLNGRQISNLFSLTAGVEGSSAPRTNGMKVGATDMVLDGISLVDRFGGGMSSVQPGLDIVQEFRFETAGSDAQYSRPATVTMASKSGTNGWHGNVFETFRNNYGGLRARQRMDSNATPAKYIRNEYGGTVSGPVIKNKMFWLFSYEAMKLRQQKYGETATPTDAIWAGDFSGATDSSGKSYTIYDPLSTAADGTRTAFPDNKIPTARLSSFAATMKSVTPAPTNLSANPWVTPNFTVYYPNAQNMNTETAKYDYVISEKDNLSVRFTRAMQNRAQTGNRYGFPPVDCTNCGGSSATNNGLYSIYARENHVFSPTFMNEFQVSVNRAPNHQGTLSDSTDWATKLGLPNPFGSTGWPTIFTDTSQFLYGGGWDSDNFKDQKLTQFQVEDNVTKVKGKHTLQFGFRGRSEYNNVREMQQAQGNHSFNADWTAQYDPTSQNAVSYTGLGFASLELGLPTDLTNQYNRGYFYFRQKEVGLYFQDSWKVTSRLTINYGIRWDKWTPYKEKYNRFVNFDPFALSSTGMEVITPGSATMESLPGVPKAVLEAWAARGLTWKTADAAGFPSALIPSPNTDFGPRLGAAYRLSDKFVLRASYGMYHWATPLSQILQSSRKNAPLNLRFENQIENNNGQNYVYAISSVPASSDYVGNATVSPTGISSSSQGFTALDPNHWSDDRLQQWTFVVEREVNKNSSVRLSYIGNHASNLEQRWSYNDAMPLFNYRASTGLIGSTNNDTRRNNPNWSGQAVRHDGYSNTQSLQAELEHRTSHGLTFQGFYTWAHTMTTTDTNGSSSGDGNANNTGSGYSYLVPMNSQIMGNPNLSDEQRLRLGYTNSGDVPPHHVRWNGVYELPFGKGKRFGSGASSLLNYVIGGWSVGFIGEWRSGTWMGVNANERLFGDPTLSKDERFDVYVFGRQRQVYFRGDFDSKQATGANATQLLTLVPADYSQRILRKLGANNNQIPQTLANGTVVNTGVTDLLNWNARNFYQGPGMWNEDLSFYKDFRFRERYRLRFTGDFFNAFNHPNSVNPDTTTGLLDLTQQVNDPRIIQFSAKFEF
jgi:hypothetical protein